VRWTITDEIASADLSAADIELISIASGDFYSNAIQANAREFNLTLEASTDSDPPLLRLRAFCRCDRSLAEIPSDCSLMRLAHQIAGRGQLLLDDFQDGTDPAGISTQDPELSARFDPVEGGRRLANYLRVLTMEAQTIARACGKAHVLHLEPEDLVAVSIEAAAMARVPLAGTDWIPGQPGAGL